MNNLVQIREKIKRAERLHKAQLLATQNGIYIPYKPSVYAKRLKQALKEVNN